MLKKTWWLAIPIVGLLIIAVVSTNAAPGAGNAVTTRAAIVASYPHDPAAFSQGLAVEGDLLYEGTGQYGNSSLRKVDLQSGKVLAKIPLTDRYFGEGITILGDRIYQLTWREKLCVVYDKLTLNPIASLPYRWKQAGEGWGIANDGQQLYISDGTLNIMVVDPANLNEIRRIRVKDGRRNVDRINELEFVEGELLANIWYSDQIARIDPATGNVNGWIDCSAVYPARQRPDREHVLNGIAYDAESGKLFITGKNWPKLYEIKIAP